MTNWVYPLGTATDGKWEVSIGTSDYSLTVEGWAHTGLKVATLAAGAEMPFSYRQHWCWQPPEAPPVAGVSGTRSGAA